MQTCFLYICVLIVCKYKINPYENFITNIFITYSQNAINYSFFFSIWGGKFIQNCFTDYICHLQWQNVYQIKRQKVSNLQMKIFCYFDFCYNRRNALAKTWPVISHSLKIWTYERLYILRGYFFLLVKRIL